jgi:protocatechuate 3,4-dioxygenase beta subunit
MRLLAAAFASLALAALVAGARASADTTPGCPDWNSPDTLRLAGGSPQTTKLGTPFGDGLQVVLVNSNGCPVTAPVAGQEITFTAPSSGASGTFASTGTNSVTVGANGSGAAAAPQFTANRVAGSYSVVATSIYGQVVFTVTNTATGVVASVAADGPTRQSATVGERYTRPFSVKVLDANGDPVSGTTVTFSLGQAQAGGGGGGGSTGPGASFDGGATQATAVTDDTGAASSPAVTANDTAGTFTASASVQGVSQPLVFRLDNLAGKPPVLKRRGAARQSANVNARFRAPLEVAVHDASGQPVAGTTVTFSLGDGNGAGGGGAGGGGGAQAAGATFLEGQAQATATTDARGIAVSPLFTANAVAGLFTATASVTGATQPASFTLDNLAGKPPVLKRRGVARQSAKVNARFRTPLEVAVHDASGRPVQGTTVTFSLGGAGGAGGSGGSGGAQPAGATFVGGQAQATATTDARGIAVSPLFTANAVAGLFTATASINGVTQPASFTLDNLAVRAPEVTALGGGRRVATVDGRFAGPLRVRVAGPDGPVAGATVTFAIGGAGGNSGGGANNGGGGASAGATFAGGSAQATATTDARGIAVSPPLTANTVAGTFAATATTSAAQGQATFALRNVAARAASIAAGAAASESATVGSQFPVRPAVVVTDAKGNPVAGARVTFKAPAHGPSGQFMVHGHARSAVTVATDATGAAVAPPFHAGSAAGGYALVATVGGAARPAAFALVNLPAE